MIFLSILLYRLFIKCYDYRFAAAGAPDPVDVRRHRSDGAFLAGYIDRIALFSSDHRTELKSVVERHDSVVESEDY